VLPREHAVVERLRRILAKLDRLTHGLGATRAGQVAGSDFRPQDRVGVDDLLHRPHCGLRTQAERSQFAVDQLLQVVAGERVPLEGDP